VIDVKIFGIRNVLANFARAAIEAKKLAKINLLRAGLLVQRELRALVSAPGGFDPFWGKTSGTLATMTGRSGKTRQRIAVGPVLEAPGGHALIAVGSPDPHMALQERGGTVSGKQFLRIPTALAQTAAGVDINVGRSVRGLPGYRVIRTGSGNLWIVRDGGRGQRPDFMYLLKRSVHIRARRIFSITQLHTEPQISRMFHGAVTEVVRTGNG